MDEAALLSHLQGLEEDAASYTWGRLGNDREQAMREYFRLPYGNEEEGWSSIVTSEVQDTVEWLLPDLIDVFHSTDKAVSFEPTKAEDVKGAEQATDTCNYVFYKQNNGFLILYTAFKDALLAKNCAVMWRKQKERVKTSMPMQVMNELQIAMALEQDGVELEAADPLPPQIDPMTGMQALDQITGAPLQLFNVRLTKTEEKTSIKVEAFPPENLLIQREWTSPLLEDCPYVARIMPVTLSELHEMGYTDVVASDLSDSDEPISSDKSFRDNRTGNSGEVYSANNESNSDDESQTRGHLRIEFALVDVDGDGIAERRCIYRLKDKILKNEETSHVPIATASPILIPHRWDGMSAAETVSDIQQLNTEITRQMLNGAYLANNPRTKVLTDANWAPLANIDDLLDSRPGAILRQRQGDAIQEHVTPWNAGQMFPMLERVDGMLEKRTGVARQNQGLDPDSLNRTKGGTSMIMNASQKRVKLIARIMAELLLKPVFQGILKLLTDGEMKKIAFRLRNEFVEYDPNEWRDHYDMTINVGLGTGDREQQLMHLGAIYQNQMMLAQSPFGPALITPTQIYNTQAKLVENAGFKNVGDFWQDPSQHQPPPPAPPPPDPAIVVAQMKLQAEAQKFQAESQQNMHLEQLKAEAKQRETELQLQLQAANDQRDSERELLKAQYEAQLEAQKLELQRYQTDADNQTRILVAQINAQAKPATEANQGY